MLKFQIAHDGNADGTSKEYSMMEATAEVSGKKSTLETRLIHVIGESRAGDGQDESPSVDTREHPRCTPNASNEKNDKGY